MIGLMILFVLCSISSVSAIDLNDTQSVDADFVAISNDDVQLSIQQDDNLSSGSFNELQNQINKASNGAVIKLSQDYSVSGDSGISIGKSLTINGQGHTIDCSNLEYTYLFDSSSGKITLENLVIKNNKNMRLGFGAIYIRGTAEYTINNCTFMANTASDGGAIYNGVRENTLTVKNSKFINCGVSGGSGGAIYSRGNLIIENCYFEGNTALIDGAAVYSDKIVKVINTKFISNKLSKMDVKHPTYGGAIYSGDAVYVERCQFTNNAADDLGGAIFSYANIVVKNSSFTKNSALKGGAIYSDSSNVVISTSTFTDNAAKSGEGGAIYSSKWTHIENSTFTRNTADAKGGAVYTNYIQFGPNVFFINNTAKDHGGAVYTDYISSNVCNINFNGNKVTRDFGGAIYINKKSGDVSFINSTFIANSATAGDGGAIFSDSGSTNIILINSTFKNNYATGGKEKRYGGAVRCKNKLTVDNCTFIDNWAENLGGAIYTDLLDSIKNSVFISNHAKEGGAIYVNNKCTMSIINTYFSSNKATDGRGGAIYTDSKSASLTINNNVFLGNDASGQGKDVFNSGKYSSIQQNWWGTNSPSFNNEKLMEYHTIGRNEKHSDGNPNKVSISGDSKGYVGVDSTIKVTFTSGVSNYEFSTIKLSSDKKGTFTTKNIAGNSLEVIFVPNEEGTHKITATVDSETLTYNLAVGKISVYGKDMTKVQGDNKTFTAVFKDSNGNYLNKGSEVAFEINKVEYKAKVSSNGVAQLTSISNLQPGVYTVKSINKVTGESFTNQLKIVSRNATYNINDIFSVKFASEKLKNGSVIFKVGSYTFNANITDDIAYCQLNVKAGDYAVKVLHNNKEVYTINIKVLNKYSQTPAILNKTSYGSLIPLYTNETFNKASNVIYSNIGDNLRRYIFPNGESSIIYNVTVSNNGEFENVLKKISGNDFRADIIIINLKKDTYKLASGFYKDKEWSYYIHLTHGALYINGNGATIDDNYKNGFITLEKGTKISVNNLTFTRFKRVFVNNGEVYCNGVSFVKNDASFWATTTQGSVIYNKNTATFINCVFDKNDNRHGASVYTYQDDMPAAVLYAEPGSLTNFVLCDFKTDYDTIHAVDGSMVVLYDKNRDNFNKLTKDLNNNFEAGSCLDYRPYSSFNVNRTATYTYNNVLKLAKDNRESIFNSNSSSFIFNLDKKTYTISSSDYNNVAFKNDFRSYNSKATFATKGGKKDNYHIRHGFLFDIGSRPVVINGNGAEIKLSGSSDKSDNHFAFVPKYGSLTLINLTISGFNDAIVNYGKLIIINCTFKDNRIHYFYQNAESEFGGAIRNYDSSYVYNTTFTNNRASYGGAYFGKGVSSFAQFYNCSFSGNTRLSNLAWYNGNDNPIYLDENAVVKVIGCNGLSKSNIITKNDGLVLYRDSLNETIYNLVVNDVSDLYKLSVVVNSNDNYDVINVSFVNKQYGAIPNSKILFDFNYGNLILNGNGATIFVQNPDDKDETQFLVTKKRSSVFINNLTIQGFNIAIYNKGTVSIFNSHMNNNRVDYNVKSDYGGAIVNEGSVLIYNSTFANNYAKYAGAIYNKGTLSIVASDFSNNKGYSSKSNVDVYNQEAAVSIVSVKSYPSVTDHFPRPAWQQDLIETSITLAITLVTAGVSCGVSYAEIAAAHYINMLVGTVAGTIGGLANAISYSVDNHDYSQFASRLLSGINDGVSAVAYGEGLNLIIKNSVNPIANQHMAPEKMQEIGINKIFDSFVKASIRLVKDVIIA